MPLTQAVSISDLVLDLKNFRTVEQENESEAVQAMIAVSPDYFWGLMDSLIQDGYLPTENIIVRWSSNFGHNDRFTFCHFLFVDRGWQIAQC